MEKGREHNSWSTLGIKAEGGTLGGIGEPFGYREE